MGENVGGEVVEAEWRKAVVESSEPKRPREWSAPFRYRPSAMEELSLKVEVGLNECLRTGPRISGGSWLNRSRSLLGG